MQRTIDTPEPIDLTVEFNSGDLKVDAGDVEQTQVTVTGPRADEFHIAQHGRAIEVIGPKRSGLFSRERHDVAITAPLDSNVATKLGSADSTLSGRFAALRLKTGSGDVSVDEAAGPAIIESGSGDIEVGSIGDLRVKSGSGDIEVGEATGRVGISTGSGDVLVGRSRHAVTVKTGSGDLSVTRAEGEVGLSTGSGDLVVGAISKGSVVAKNASGNVLVGVPAGTPTWTDITSTTGEVRNHLEPTGPPADGQDYVEIRATSVTGDITLAPAR